MWRGGGGRMGLERACVAEDVEGGDDGAADTNSSSDDSFSNTGRAGRGAMYCSKGESGRAGAACVGRAAAAAAESRSPPPEPAISSSSDPYALFHPPGP